MSSVQRRADSRAFQAQRSTKIERSVKVSGMFGQAPASGAAKDGSEKADTARTTRTRDDAEKTAKDPAQASSRLILLRHSASPRAMR